MDVAALRLRNQKLIRTGYRKPEEIVGWLGAMQAQDSAGARWAIGLRTNAVTDSDVQRACDDGRILRTHILRPTWHFVTPADIRWMLSLCGPRLHAVNAPYYRRNGLDEETVRRSRSTIAKALAKGAHLTRHELASVLAKRRIPAAGERLAYLMMRAELDGVICSGARRGNQSTYALLDARAPAARIMKRDEALATLAVRYFTGHGPATLRDFVWWSGLTVKDAKSGVDAAGKSLAHVTVDGLAYWFSARATAKSTSASSVRLLPNYDEYLIAYKDRGTISDPPSRAGSAVSLEFGHFLIVDGKLRGRWKRTLGANGVVIAVKPFRPLTAAERRDLKSQTARYGKFMGRPVTIDSR
ncbi:MAG: winged helix DNA-binding domain-containing protein [Acidobacteriota bacterium]